MAFPLAWVVLAAVLVVVPLLCSLLIRRYSEPEDSTCMTTGVASLAVSLALLCVLLVPVDIYTVSAGADGDTGVQKHPGDVHDASDSLGTLYYSLYGALFAFAFFFMPYAYFYFEEGDDERVSGRSRVCAALGYTAGFVFMFALLLGLGVAVKKDNFGGEPPAHNGTSSGGGDNGNGPGSYDQWKHELSEDYGDGDAMVSFVVGALGVVGLFGWLVYTAYGLAHLPVSLMRRMDAEEAAQASVANARSGRLVRDEDLPRSKRRQIRGAAQRTSTGSATLDLRRARAEIEHLERKNAGRGRAEWSSRDRAKLASLEGDERRAAGKVAKEERKNGGKSSASSSLRPRARDDASAATRAGDAYTGAADKCTRCCAGCWNAMAPVRIVVGVLLLLVSLLVVVSITISQVDKLQNSECGASCGYTIGTPSLVNPLDKTLGFASRYFPADYAFFGGLTLYLFVCALAGLVALGVRLLCWRLHDVRPGGTMPNALLLGAWLLMFTVLLLNLQLLNLSPQYVTFGEQQYLDEHKSLQPCSLDLCYANGTAVGRYGSGNCTEHRVWAGYTEAERAPGSLCVMTRVSRFILSTQLAVPVYGVVYFYANFLFVAVFLVSLLCVACRRRAVDASEYRRVYEF